MSGRTDGRTDRRLDEIGSDRMGSNGMGWHGVGSIESQAYRAAYWRQPNIRYLSPDSWRPSRSTPLPPDGNINFPSLLFLAHPADCSRTAHGQATDATDARTLIEPDTNANATEQQLKFASKGGDFIVGWLQNKLKCSLIGSRCSVCVCVCARKQANRSVACLLGQFVVSFLDAQSNYMKWGCLCFSEQQQ